MLREETHRHGVTEDKHIACKIRRYAEFQFYSLLSLTLHIHPLCYTLGVPWRPLGLSLRSALPGSLRRSTLRALPPFFPPDCKCRTITPLHALYGLPEYIALQSVINRDFLWKCSSIWSIIGEENPSEWAIFFSDINLILSCVNSLTCYVPVKMQSFKRKTAWISYKMTLWYQMEMELYLVCIIYLLSTSVVTMKGAYTWFGK